MVCIFLSAKNKTLYEKVCNPRLKKTLSLHKSVSTRLLHQNYPFHIHNLTECNPIAGVHYQINENTKWVVYSCTYKFLGSLPIPFEIF